MRDHRSFEAESSDMLRGDEAVLSRNLFGPGELGGRCYADGADGTQFLRARSRGNYEDDVAAR